MHPTHRNPRYVAILAAASCLILIGGWLARPRAIPQTPPPVPTETELEHLARRAERRTLDSTAKYFRGVARDAEPSVSYIRGPAVSGIAWDQARVVTSPLDARWSQGPLPLAVDGAEIKGQLTTWGPNLPLAVLAVPHGSPGFTPAPRAQGLPATGTWIAAVWRTGTASAYAVGNFNQSSAVRCGVSMVQEIVSSLSLADTMVGGGIFDLDGGLLGIVLPCDGRLAAVATASIESVLDHADSAEQRVRGYHGFSVSPLSAEEIDHFKTRDGLLVREVWTGYAADKRGIRPGDIITTANGRDVTTVDELAALATSAGAPVELTIRRARKTLNIALSDGAVEAAGPEPGGAGLLMAQPVPTTYPIEAVRSGSRADLAGIRAGDRILRIDQAEPRSVQQIDRILGGSQPKPAWLEIVRDGRRLGVLLR